MDGYPWQRAKDGTKVLITPSGLQFHLTLTRHGEPTVERVDHWLKWIADRPDRDVLAADTDALLDARALIALEELLDT